MIYDILYSFLFIISSALAASGIVISIELNKKYDVSFFQSLIFAEVFLAIFGFYGIWGQIILNKFVSPFIEADFYTRLTHTALLSSFPFLIVGFVMLIIVCLHLTKRKIIVKLHLLIVILAHALLIATGFVLSGQSDINFLLAQKIIFILLTVLFHTGLLFILLRNRKRDTFITTESLRILTLCIFTLMLLQIATSLYIGYHPLVLPAFIIIYYLGFAFIPVYLRFGAEVSLLMESSQNKLSFKDFCQQYEITDREAEVVKQIYAGLSNQEIADKLFISLQTVKGHTHRIYYKTNIRSRAQLIAIVNKLK